MTNNTQLLPCPFCGKAPKVDEPVIRDGTAWAYIRCDSYCGVKPLTSGSGDTHYYDKPWLEEGKHVEYRSQDEAKAFAMNLAAERWNTRPAPAEDVRAVAPTIDFNEEILLPCPPGVRVGFCGDVKLSFDGAEYRGRAWLMEQGGKEEWVAIEGPDNARKAGEALIKWAEAWEGQAYE